MKQLDAKYNEIEFVKSQGGQGEEHRDRHGMPLNSREWGQTLEKLAATFDKSGSHLVNGKARPPGAPMGKDDPAVRPYQSIPTGRLSSLQEDENCYYATAVIAKTGDRLKLATVAWQKEPMESWLARSEYQARAAATAAGTYALPTIPDGAACIDNAWSATAGPPDIRYGHTAVWTGSEMIIWGGGGSGDYPYWSFRNTGARYDPSTDTWTTTSTAHAPSGRVGHTAMWTGAEMIAWGGLDALFHITNTGGRYDPNTNSWTATSTINAPSPR